ncbi:MAG: DUF1330 domain-containing protein [Paracoccaceae bacterium]
MAHYIIAHVTVTDDAWVPDYAAQVHDIAAKHGGKYLSRSGNIEALEGEVKVPTLIAIIEFPDAKSAKAFATDAEYAPHMQARREGSRGTFVLIDDTDVAGAIPYLPKG